MLGAPSLPCWPRGLPLHDIKVKQPLLNGRYLNRTDNENRVDQFAVLQSLADVQPDVDAIFRLTRQTPFQFKRPKSFHAPSVQRGIIMLNVIMHLVHNLVNKNIFDAKK